MKKKYKQGLLEVLDSFREYADKVLPEEISEKAVPSETAVKRMYAKNIIASEPRNYERQRKETHINSLGPAFINPNWRYCGVESFAWEHLGWSKSKFEKAMNDGLCCRGDWWSGYTLYVPCSYDHLLNEDSQSQDEKAVSFDTTPCDNIK